VTIRTMNIELHERAGQRVLLPWRGFLAGAQANDGVADPHCLAGAKRQFAAFAVALVEQADNGDPLRHRRTAGRHRRRARFDGFHGFGRRIVCAWRRCSAD
jgi:hypothetical protein